MAGEAIPGPHAMSRTQALGQPCPEPLRTPARKERIFIELMKSKLEASREGSK